MATTTNYGWTTPDDTSLVKDGASAIRTLGSSIDTSVKSLSPGTTAGDIDYYTSSTAKSRLAIGSTGQVLTVAGGVPSWATSSSGGMTLLSTTTLSGVTTTISGISQSYTNLLILIYGVTNATSDSILFVRPNGGTASGFFTGIRASNNTTSSQQSTSIKPTVEDSYLRTSANNSAQILISNYASSVAYKPFIASSVFLGSTLTLGSGAVGGWSSNTAISSISITTDNAVSLTAGTCLIYGVK